MLAQPDRGRRQAARGHRQPQFRQSGAAGDHGPVRRSDPRHRRGLQGAQFPGRVRQRLALQRDQWQGDPADAVDRRRRADRRFHQVGLARLQARRRGNPAHRRDDRLARPVDVPARAVRAGRGRAAAGRPHRGARERRFRPRADPRRHRDGGARSVRRRSGGGARRNGDGVRDRRQSSMPRPTISRRMPIGSARIRRATSSRCRRQKPKLCSNAPARRACWCRRSAPPAAMRWRCPASPRCRSPSCAPPSKPGCRPIWRAKCPPRCSARDAQCR